MLLLTHECSFVFRANYVKVDAEEAGESTGWHRMGSNSDHFWVIYNMRQLFRLAEWLSASQVGYFCTMLVTPFSLSGEEVEFPELRSAGNSTKLYTTYVTECSVIKHGGNMPFQNACIHLPDYTVSQLKKEQSKLSYM
jgi:hypothetical protein